MRRSTAWLLLASAAGALALTPSGPQRPWTLLPLPTDVGSPPEQRLRAETAPKPTPRALPLMARQASEVMGPGTCGSVVRDNGYVTCSGDGSCIVSGNYIGCCNACAAIQSVCVDYKPGTCNPGTKGETLCCAQGMPYCGTYTNTGTPALTNVACGSTSGDGGQFFVNPTLLESRSFSASTLSSRSASQTPTAAVEPVAGAGDSGGRTNVGAIVGGLIGGLAALGLIAVAVILLLRRRRDRRSDSQRPFPSVPVIQSQPRGATAYAPLPQGYDGRTSVLGQQPSSGQNQNDVGPYFAKPHGQNTLSTPDISPKATPPLGVPNQYPMGELAAVPARGS